MYEGVKRHLPAPCRIDLAGAGRQPGPVALERAQGLTPHPSGAGVGRPGRRQGVRPRPGAADGQMLGIEHPIIAAPMGPDLTGPDLVAAVSNAGGLGILQAQFCTPPVFREEIRRVRAAHCQAVRGKPAAPLPRRGSGRHLPGRAGARPLPVLG